MTVFKVIYKCSFQIIWKDEKDDINLPSFARTQGSSPAHPLGVDTKHPAPGFWKQMRIGQGLNPSGIKQAERQTKDALDKILCSFSWKLKLQEVAFFKVLILFPPIQRGQMSSPPRSVLCWKRVERTLLLKLSECHRVLPALSPALFVHIIRVGKRSVSRASCNCFQDCLQGGLCLQHCPHQSWLLLL